MSSEISYINLMQSNPSLIMRLIDYLESKNYNYVYCGFKPDMFDSKPVCFEPNEEGVELFNDVLKHIPESIHKLQRTPSGGIAININNTYAYDFRHSSNGGIITIVVAGRLYVFKLGHWGVKKNDYINPSTAFNMFMSKCEEFGIDLDDYAIENGEEVKKTIPVPYIWMDESILNNTLYSVHHIDFHNSYPAGLVNTHPEFKEVVEFFYNGRKKNPKYKLVLNMSIGYMQSMKIKRVAARWANLSKDAITDNNKRIDELAERLLDAGCRIIGMNTDGIWYQSERPYHGEGEGKELGQWENDHVNCKFRAKSGGCYEFIEKGKYNPVVRGLIAYDAQVPREEWAWGDIYKGEVKLLEYTEQGYIIKEDDYDTIRKTQL